MAVPKYKPSKSRSRRRRAINSKLSVTNLSTCSNCGAKKLPHRVCPKCGFYHGKQIIEPEQLT